MLFRTLVQRIIFIKRSVRDGLWMDCGQNGRGATKQKGVFMKLQNMKRLQNFGMISLIGLGLLVTGPSALAKGGGSGFVTNLDLTMTSSESSDETTTPATESKSTSTIFDLNLGYAMSNGLYLGFLYVSGSISSTSGGSTTSPALAAYGPSVGYMASNGFFVTGHYLLNSDYTGLTAAGAKWTKGSGIQADLGYQMNMMGSFNLGVLLIYRSVTYTNFNDGTTDSTINFKQTDMYPMLRLGFMF